MRFSSDLYDHLNGGYDSIFDDTIIISKRVKSIRQLKNSDKEWVRLCYKEAILKGFNLTNHIQCYIASKTKIWIERSGIEYLKKSEDQENKKWFCRMAKDQYVYIDTYRKSIDELNLVEKECWRMISNPKVENSVKVQCLREMHSITKTMTLLLRDLPFVTNLTKYYDQDTLKLMLNQSEEITPVMKEKLDYQDDNSTKNNTIKESEKTIKKSGLEGLIGNSSNKISDNQDTNQVLTLNVDDFIMEQMSSQLKYDAKDFEKVFSNKKYLESIRKLKEISEE